MTGYLEPLCAHVSYLRLGPECRVFPDKWEWGVTVVHQPQGAALIVGLNGRVQGSHWKGVQDVLRDAGISVMRFVRRDRESGALVLHEHSTHRRRESDGPARASSSGPTKENKTMPADYQVELTLTTKSLKSGKSGTTVQTFEGDAAFRRAVQRDLLNLQLTWLDAEDAAASNAPAEAATK